MADDNTVADAVELAAELTAAWLSNANTRTAAEDVPAFMRAMHTTIQELRGSSTADQGQEAVSGKFEGAVTIRKSLADPNFIISMIDGKPYKTLKRHLANNGLTPAEYRERYGLKADYPIVAPAYAETRRALAKQIGLGRRQGEKPAPATKARKGQTA
ncbi:MucR family transcriptional regulator [Sphingomonas sp. FW199]|uniref:MucR family transcriptional regulator n=1 Tax=Sphingomonas sp. FW199 TaxID=3400217 RepID=UPI003CF12F75